MLYEVLAVILVVLFVGGFAILFNRRRAAMLKVSEEDYPEIRPEEAAAPETPDAKAESDKTTEIFASVDTSNTQDATGFGYDAAGESAVKNLAFEEKLGKDTVVVELPAPKVARKVKADKPAPKVAKKEPPVKLGATPEELVKILERKIARRVDVLKVAKLPESDDVTLKRYRSKLAELKAKIAETAIKTALNKAKVAETAIKTTLKDTTEKAAKPAKKSGVLDSDVIVVTSPAVKKSAKKAKKVTKKPAKKKSAKKTKKTKKSSK